jgi:hypothetical protein
MCGATKAPAPEAHPRTKALRREPARTSIRHRYGKSKIAGLIGKDRGIVASAAEQEMWWGSQDIHKARTLGEGHQLRFATVEDRSDGGARLLLKRSTAERTGAGALSHDQVTAHIVDACHDGERSIAIEQPAYQRPGTLHGLDKDLNFTRAANAKIPRIHRVERTTPGALCRGP